MNSKLTALRGRAAFSVIASWLLWCGAGPVSAAPVVFDLDWSGASFGNTATATGQITIDDAVLANPGNNSTDTDGDGKSDLAEYFADTDPFDFADHAQIVAIGRDEMTSEIFIEWTSSPRRLYQIGSTSTLDGFTVDFDNLAPNPGPTTTVMFADPVVERKFWQVGAKLPLAPPAP